MKDKPRVTTSYNHAFLGYIYIYKWVFIGFSGVWWGLLTYWVCLQMGFVHLNGYFHREHDDHPVDLGYTIFRQAIFGVAGYDPSYIDDSRWFQMMIHKLYIYILSYYYIIFVMIFVLIHLPVAGCPEMTSWNSIPRSWQTHPSKLGPE